MSLTKKLLALFFIALILGGVVAAGYAVTQLETYALYVDGNIVEVQGSFDTVGEVVTAANIQLRAGDLVVPEMAAAISAPSTGPSSSSGGANPAIQILRAKTVNVTTDDGSTTYFTHQPTLGAFLREVQLNIGRTDQVIADGSLLSLRQINDAAVPMVLEIGRFHTITIRDGNQQRQLVTRAETVGAALEEAKITLYAADGVQPALGDWISNGLEITIERSKPLTILVDGRSLQTRSHHDTVLDVLAEIGIGLVGSDYTRPSLDATLQPNDTIEVVRVTEDFLLEDEPIPYESLWQASDQLEIDTTGLIQAGQPGILRRRTRIVYENGVETGRFPDGEWVAQEPSSEILGYGIKIVVRTLDTPNGPIEYWRKVRMRVTSYTAASSGKAPDHPRYGITRSGLPAGYGIVAIDMNVVPWRSDVYVDGYGVGHAGDTGGGVKGRWIDLGYDEHNYVGWRGYTDVYYLTPVPEPERINFLIPDWLP